jgi:hypothetical protein
MLINFKKLTALTVMAFAATGLTPCASHAAANEYSLTQNINVALLRIPSAGQSGPVPTAGSLRSPYIFDILNNRPDIKPPVWNLQNPMAPLTIDTETNSRYGNAYADNQQVTPSMAPYWEVDFNKISSAAQLSQFNLLVIRADTPSSIDMTITERGILRQYVDQGGTLWIDSNMSKTFSANVANSIVYDTIFRVIFGGPVPTNATTTSVGSYHPIATSPYSFAPTAIDALGYGGMNDDMNGAGSGCLSLTSALNVSDAPDPSMFVQISPTVIAGDYGSGHVIIDGLGVGDWINLDGGTQSAYQGVWQGGTTYSPGAVVSYNGFLYHCVALSTGNEPDQDLYSANLTPYHHQFWAANGDSVDATIFSSASAQDLKFLVNIISYATSSMAGGANDRGSNAQAGNTAGALSSSWQYFEPSSSITPDGIATYGKFVYETDSAGVLSCFDVYPSESIFGTGALGDDGAVDYSQGTSYDMIWKVTPSSNGGALSAPVIAQVPVAVNGGPVANEPAVLVEDEGGNIYAYPAVSNGSPTQLFKITGNSSGGSFAVTPPPAPSYYRGQVIAPEPDSSGVGLVGAWNLLNLTASSTISYPTTNTANSFTFPVGDGNWIQPIQVASVPSQSATSGGETVVGYAVSEFGINTVQLGSRDEQMAGSNGSDSIYSTYTGGLSTASDDLLFGAPEDTLGTVDPNDWILDYNSDNNNNVFDFGAQAGAIANNVAVNVAQQETLYADYNVIPSQNTAAVRTTVTAATAGGGQQNGSSAANAVVGAAVGPDNMIYATVNEPGASTGSAYIEAINEVDPTAGNQKIAWRFELNGTAASPTQDFNGITFAFDGDQFEGPPIVGSNGLVYAIAKNPNGSVDVFAFNANPQVGIDVPSTAPGTTNALQGPLNYTEANEFGSQPVTTIDNQHLVNGQIVNFAGGTTITTDILTPAIFAPGLVQIQGTDSNGIAQGPQVPVWINTAYNGATPMLEWYTELPNTIATGPARLIGDYLYFGAESGLNSPVPNQPFTVSVYSNPSAIGLQPNSNTRIIYNQFYGSPQINNGVTVNFAPDYRFVQITPTRLAQVSLPPVGTSKYIVTAGGSSQTNVGGLEGLVYNRVVVADGTRLIEFDPAGNATWTLDSTQQNTPNGTAVSSSSQALETTSAETSVALNRPTTVTQLSADDYLIADSGNNRCVHVDRSGNVLTQLTDAQGNTVIPIFNGVTNSLEISNFSDPLGLLPVGQPTTLNRPNSVVTWETYDYGTNATGPLQAINVHYLISDTGNSRVLDVVDRYTSTKVGGGGNLFELATSADFHYLDWISRTSDVGGRLYAYNGAEPMLLTSLTNPTVYYPDNPTTANTDYLQNQASAIIADVGNKFIPALDLTQTSHLTQIDQDAVGSSILLLTYTSGLPYGANNPTGLPSSPSSLINSVEYIPDVGGANNVATYLPLRGLTSAVATTNVPATPAFGQFVVSDADGVFYGTFANGSTNISNTSYPYTLDATYGNNSLGWSFTGYDYNNAVTAYDTELNAIAPLQPSTTLHQDYQGTGFVPSSAIELSGNNFLIANRGATQNQNALTNIGVDNGFGGNVFTIHATISSSSAPVDTLDGPIFGKPANTGPLSAPAFALQSN